MVSAKQFRIVLVTAPDLKSARKLARAVLAERAAACVNLVPGVESHYWWQGKFESRQEVLLIVKSAVRKLKALEKIIVANHPYDTPEILVLPLESGAERYVGWLRESLTLPLSPRK